MIASLVVSGLILSGDIARDLEAALSGGALSGPRFRRDLAPVLSKYGAEDPSSLVISHTLGDKRGLLLTLSGSGAQWDSNTSWRVFIWPKSGSGVRAQVIDRYTEGADSKSNPIDSYTEGKVYWKGGRLMIVGTEVNARNFAPAAATVYALKDGHWRETQHLISRYEGQMKIKNASHLTAETAGPAKYFMEPHAGPNLLYSEDWTLGGSRFVHTTRPIQTPLAEMDRLSRLVAKGQFAAFNKIAPKKLRTKLWQGIRSRITSSFASSDSTDNWTTKFALDPGHAVVFSKDHGRWKPSHLN